jgi:ADP-ribose pyrophosphatase YjhB (NUDIX family)
MHGLNGQPAHAHQSAGPDCAGLMRAVLSTVEDARAGLPEPVFLGLSALTPMVNVDLLIKSPDGASLLTWRADRFYGPGWHIPGGIVRFKEQMADRAAKVAELELGATVKVHPQPLMIREIMHPSRDERGHFISFLLACELSSELPPSMAARAELPEPGQWAWFDRAPPNLISQHAAYAPILNGNIPRRSP